tara:strand:+ start:5745 stop:6842 length:1098 start_codon:yes stop_codon:yes gene_type:complete
MPVGFAIVGCGMIADFHAKAIADIRGARLVACTSRNPDSSDRFAKEQNCRSYHDIHDMLNDSQIDVVTICNPSGAHMEPAVASANAGKHVIVEKPLEITLKRCDKIIQACKANRVTLSTVFPSRFHKSSQLMKQAADKKKFGRITMGDAYVKWYRTQEYYDSGAWRGTWNLDGGGALMNQAIHSVDLLLWLMGPVVSITAQGAMLAHKRIEVEDTVVATLRFKSGALGVIEATTAAYPGALKRIELHGSDGSAVLEEEDIKVWEFAKMTATDRRLVAAMAGNTKTGGGAADPSAIGHHAHMLQFKDVLNAIRNKKKPLIDGIEGRKSVEVIQAIYKAAATGRTVELPLKSDPKLRYHQQGVGKHG